jgi:hypothetical protein
VDGVNAVNAVNDVSGADVDVDTGGVGVDM